MSKREKWIPGENAWFRFEGNDCIDIKVEEGKKSVTLNAKCFKLRNCKRTFPDVTTLVIPSGTKTIDMPNFLFPNVKEVVSKSGYFFSGPLLVAEKSAVKVLLNTFCKPENEIIDLSDITVIENFAFEGCCSINIINDRNVSIIRPQGFAGSAFMEQPFIHGLKFAGRTLIEMDATAEEIELPQERKSIYVIEGFSGMENTNIKRIRVKNLYAFDDIKFKLKGNIAPTIIIDTPEKCNPLKIRKALGIVGNSITELVSEVPRYKSVDGILYSNDMKKLYFCPRGKTGDIVIPEGVERIKTEAFSCSKINSVKFPDSLQVIEREAFSHCHSLVSVDFGHGITALGANGQRDIFLDCSKLKRLDFPAQLKYIGIGCFSFCDELESITFHEGLEEIAKDAFFYCPSLRSVNFPKTLKILGNEAFVSARAGVQEISLTSIPKGFINAVTSHNNGRTAECIRVCCNDAASIHSLAPGQRPCENEQIMNQIYFVIPLKMDTARRSDCAQHFDPDSPYYKITDEFLNFLYLYSKYRKGRVLTAAFIYQHTMNPKVRAKIKEDLSEIDVGYELLHQESENLSEKEFVQILSSGFVEATLQMMTQAREKGWTVAAAYIMDKLTQNENSRPTMSSAGQMFWI